MVRLFLCLFLGFSLLHAEAQEFPRYPELAANVKFWTRVYSEWTSRQVALFDSEDLHLVYRVIDVPDYGERFLGLKRDKIIERAKKDVIEALAYLDQHKPASDETLSGITKAVYISLKGIERPDK